MAVAWREKGEQKRRDDAGRRPNECDLRKDKKKQLWQTDVGTCVSLGSGGLSGGSAMARRRSVSSVVERQER
jgi:hypothetical protein